MCATACQSAAMLVLCSNVTVGVKKLTCASVRLEWSLDQLGRHINIVIIIIIIICYERQTLTLHYLEVLSEGEI